VTVARGRLVEAFGEVWGGEPTHLVRAPGRVNLIGEHIDYCGLPVLPMAFDRAVWIAFRALPTPRVRIATETPGLEPVEIAPLPPIPPGPTGDWANYARAAIEAVEPYAGGEPAVRGLEALVVSDLPVAAGLSSSSALVVAVALAWLRVRGVPVGPETGPRLALADILARGERYVGTAGGGMDQAACLLGRSGHALRIEFGPLRATPIPIPRGWRFVVAHSGARAEKSGPAQATYNARTREAAGAIAGVLDAVGGATPADGAWTLGPPGSPDPAGAYPRVLEAVGADAALAAAERALDARHRARFRHIVTERERVADAEEALRAGDLARFGARLSESHASLRDDYEVSTPALDALVDTALAAGAAGARLTGAGLGGSIVALCDAERADAVRAALISGGSDPVLLARASDGARVESR